MEPLTLFAGVLTAGVVGGAGAIGLSWRVVSGWVRRSRERSIDRVLSAAEAHGLSHRDDACAYGEVDGRLMRVGLAADADGRLDVLLSVHDLPDSLALRQRRVGDPRRPRTGDPRFDRAVLAEWRSTLDRARLPASVRQWLTPAVRAGRAWMRDGVLVVRVPAADTSEPRLQRWLDGLRFCAREIALTDGARGQRLARMALSDAEHGVRVEALRALVLEADPAASTAVAALHGTSNPELQVLRWWHEQQYGDLSIALSRTDLPPDSRSDAALGLVRADSEAITSALETLWWQPADDTWAWALKVFRHNGVRAAVPGALTLLRKTPARGVRAVHIARREALQLVAELGEPADVEPILIDLVRRDDDLRLYAIRTLGRVGTPVAVEVLLEWAETRLGYWDLRTAATRAVEQIQGRVGRAQRGGLSIAAPEGGGLALVDPRGGELSPAPDDVTPGG